MTHAAWVYQTSWGKRVVRGGWGKLLRRKEGGGKHGSSSFGGLLSLERRQESTEPARIVYRLKDWKRVILWVWSCEALTMHCKNCDHTEPTFVNKRLERCISFSDQLIKWWHEALLRNSETNLRYEQHWTQFEHWLFAQAQAPLGLPMTLPLILHDFSIEMSFFVLLPIACK